MKLITAALIINSCVAFAPQGKGLFGIIAPGKGEKVEERAFLSFKSNILTSCTIQCLMFPFLLHFNQSNQYQ